MFQSILLSLYDFVQLRENGPGPTISKARMELDHNLNHVSMLQTSVQAGSLADHNQEDG
jgi:hypothetical protein